VLGASFDSVEKNRAFAEKFSYPYKLLSFDKSNDIFEASDPSDPDWPRRISYLIGPDRHIVRAYATVKPATHPAQVIADVP
jgi:peroxiredoxin Q/BCP